MTAPAAVSTLNVQILQENVAKALGIVSRAIATRSTLPIVHNIYVGTDRGRMVFWATDLSLGIRCWKGAKIESEGAVTVPARQFKDLIATLPKATVSLRQDGTKLLGECAGTTFDLPTMAAEDFPRWADCLGGPSFQIPAPVLCHALERVAPFAATDDSRPVLTGLQCQFTGDEAIFAACDGFRLAEFRTEFISEPVSFLLPRRAALQLRELLGDSTEWVEVHVAENGRAVQFDLTDTELSSALLEGVYPNYGPLLKVDQNGSLTVKASDLLRAVRTAHIVAREDSGIIRLRFGEGKVVAYAVSEAVGGADAVVEAVTEGSGRIALNTSYVQEALSVVGDAEVTMLWQGTGNQVLWHVKDDPGYLSVNMPMFVSW